MTDEAKQLLKELKEWKNKLSHIGNSNIKNSQLHILLEIIIELTEQKFEYKDEIESLKEQVNKPKYKPRIKYVKG